MLLVQPNTHLQTCQGCLGNERRSLANHDRRTVRALFPMLPPQIHPAPPWSRHLSATIHLARFIWHDSHMFACHQCPRGCVRVRVRAVLHPPSSPRALVGTPMSQGYRGMGRLEAVKVPTTSPGARCELHRHACRRGSMDVGGDLVTRQGSPSTPPSRLASSGAGRPFGRHPRLPMHHQECCRAVR